MRKKIFRAVWLAAALAVLVSLGLAMGALYEYFAQVEYARLTESLEWARAGVERGGVDFLQSLKPGATRLTWVAGDGGVLFDSASSAETMENHGDRDEIRQALLTGVGRSSRYSATLAAQTLYYARKLGDGTVLRASVTRGTVLSLALGMGPALLLLLVLAGGLSAWLAARLSKSIAQPVNQLNLDQPLENDAYPELSPLLNRIEAQGRQLRERMEQLKRSQEEFSAVTGSMNEGLLLLNREGKVLSVNPAACRIFHTDESCLGRDLLLTDRSREVQSVADQARETGHGEGVLSRDGRVYQLEGSRVGDNAGPGGLALIAFDVTDRVNGEQNRREFTANVSHELKTPLQSILGNAELMEKGLVKPSDAPVFAGRIRAEAARMSRLINDVIRLSQLDEGGELPQEEADLLTLVREVLASLEPSAEKARVTLLAQGDSTPVFGPYGLIHEIVFNLCDNAVRYNRPGGRVTVSVCPKDGGGLLRVADTGVGIASGDQDLVFQRFYRVDKSHSRATGGTGLGLSIVKHAAQRLGATIEMDSRLGEGTEIRVYFPGKKSE